MCVCVCVYCLCCVSLVCARNEAAHTCIHTCQCTHAHIVYAHTHVHTRIYHTRHAGMLLYSSLVDILACDVKRPIVLQNPRVRTYMVVGFLLGMSES